MNLAVRIIGLALVFVTASCATGPSGPGTSGAGPGKSAAAHQGLVGSWDGRYTNRYTFERWELEISAVGSDGRLTGSAYIFGSCVQCRRDLAVSGKVTGADGSETVELTLADAGTISLRRQGVFMEGAGGALDATYSLRKIR